MSPNLKMSECLYRAASAWHPLMHVILMLSPIENNDCPSIGLHRSLRLYYNKEWLEKTPAADVQAAILHECAHLILKHGLRARLLVGDKTSRQVLDVARLAADCVIWDIFADEGFPIPDKAITAETLEMDPGSSMEAYFHELMDNTDGGNSLSYSADGLPCGSVGDGEPKPWEDDIPEDLDSPQDEYPSGTERLLETVRKSLEEHHKKKQAGKGHGNELREWSKPAPVQIDPAQLLRRAVSTAIATHGYSDWSYRRLSRRSSPNMPMPGMIGTMPKVTVILDTSGSMGNGDFALAAGMLEKLLRSAASGCGLTVVCGDDDVGNTQQVYRTADVHPIGGGGTDMGYLVQQVCERRDKPGLIIVLTDGYTPWMSTPPRVPTVACLTNKGCSKPPEFIHSVPLYLCLPKGESNE